MKKIIFTLLLSASTLFSATINIAVAANVSYAIDDLKKAFSKHYPETNVRVILGSSGKLTAQITHGAPYQLFMSANMKYPESLYAEKLAVSKPKVYAKGKLALISNRKRVKLSLALLTDESISRIAIANPKTAPYGKAAFEALKNAKILNEIKSKFIYGESISQTVSYTITATDIGIIAKSSLYSKNMTKFKKDENWIELDPKLYTPIKQGVIIIKDSKDSKAFYDFLLSNDAKKIFKSFGYLQP